MHLRPSPLCQCLGASCLPTGWQGPFGPPNFHKGYSPPNLKSLVTPLLISIDHVEINEFNAVYQTRTSTDSFVSLIQITFLFKILIYKIVYLHKS